MEGGWDFEGSRPPPGRLLGKGQGTESGQDRLLVEMRDAAHQPRQAARVAGPLVNLERRSSIGRRPSVNPSAVFPVDRAPPPRRARLAERTHSSTRADHNCHASRPRWGAEQRPESVATRSPQRGSAEHRAVQSQAHREAVAVQAALPQLNMTKPLRTESRLLAPSDPNSVCAAYPCVERSS